MTSDYLSVKPPSLYLKLFNEVNYGQRGSLQSHDRTSMKRYNVLQYRTRWLDHHSLILHLSES